MSRNLARRLDSLEKKIAKREKLQKQKNAELSESKEPSTKSPSNN